ncbi:MAG: hypothetical protein IPP88_09310 [Betaproteobacteria bacterium]|nr:hypothetical protein [Betaproteobacteria bacterium]
MSNSSQTRHGPFCVNGVPYLSLIELALAAKISYQRAYKRLVRGSTNHEIFFGRAKKPTADKPQRRPRGKQLTVGGQTYDNFAAAHTAIKPNCSLNAARARLRYGYSAEEALGIVFRVDGRKGNQAN